MWTSADSVRCSTISASAPHRPLRFIAGDVAMLPIQPLGRDTTLVYAAGFLRSLTVGLVGVVIAIYLSEIGFSVPAIGLVIPTKGGVTSGFSTVIVISEEA